MKTSWKPSNFTFSLICFTLSILYQILVLAEPLQMICSYVHDIHIWYNAFHTYFAASFKCPRMLKNIHLSRLCMQTQKQQESKTTSIKSTSWKFLILNYLNTWFWVQLDKYLKLLSYSGNIFLVKGEWKKKSSNYACKKIKCWLNYTWQSKYQITWRNTDVPKFKNPLRWNINLSVVQHFYCFAEWYLWWNHPKFH